MGKRAGPQARAALSRVVAVAGQAAVAHADTRVTRDSTAGSYVRYDGGTDATLLSCGTGGEPRTSPASRSIRSTPRSSSPARTTTARRSRTVLETCGPAITARPTAAHLDQQPRAGVSRQTARPPDGVAAHGSCAAAGDPTQAFDGAGPSVLRLHLLQPRQAHERLGLRRDLRPGRRPLRAHGARGPRDAVGVGTLPGQDRRHRRPGLGRTSTCSGRSIRARPPTTRCISRARPIRADVLQAGADHARPIGGAVRRRDGRPGRDALRDLPDDRSPEVDRGRDLARALDRRRRVVLGAAAGGAASRRSTRPVQRQRRRHVRRRAVRLSERADVRTVLQPIRRGRRRDGASTSSTAPRRRPARPRSSCATPPTGSRWPSPRRRCSTAPRPGTSSSLTSPPQRE